LTRNVHVYRPTVIKLSYSTVLTVTRQV